MAFFLKFKHNYLSKMHGYPIFSFWIPMVPTKIYFLRIVLNRAKISLFVSITDKKTRVSRDEQNVCAVTIVGTALNTNFSVSLHHRLGTSFSRNYPFILSLAWRTSTNSIFFLLTQNIQNVQFRNRYRICLQLVKRFS